MRFPIKFNRTYLSPHVEALLPSADDPRILVEHELNQDAFTRAISAFKFGTTCKTTQKNRFPLTISTLRTLDYSSLPVILDVGASDGTTSLDVIRSVPFRRYYVTDRNIEVRYKTVEKCTYFYADSGTCILIVTDEWVAYPDVEGAIFPFRKLVQYLFSRVEEAKDNLPRIVLMNPVLRKTSQGNVVFEKHDIFERWEREKVDLIVAANILNQSYFPDHKIQTALRNLLSALNDTGRLAVVDSRRLERATIFQLSQGSLHVEREINGGTEIQNLIMSTSDVSHGADTNLQ